MRVRATADGTYGGIYREGPVNEIPGVSGGVPGEVFDIDDKLIPAIDPESGKPILEPVLDSRGNPIIDTVMVQAVDEKGTPQVGADKKPLMSPVEKPRMKQRMYSWFNPAWMEKVVGDVPVTYEENSRPRGVHPSMRIRKQPSRQPKVLSELQEEAGKPLAEEPLSI